ncbi:MAG: peptide-methionine (S)-S-oxide reductase MsrA [Mucilaginibacter sp.]|nr:peptide-methionine (S)-S-oxide reductase MsrA [Mucilaginibacter sp.]
MKSLSISLLALLLFTGCVNSLAQSGDHAFAALPAPKTGEKLATFAGGCFWSLSEGMSELKGVNKVVAGYAGGSVKNPTYQDVCTRTTGHAESVQVYYDPSVINYATLAEAFFYAHDPTTLNRQGPDQGTDYRSAAFYRTAEEKKTLEAVIAKVNAAGHYPNPIVTQVAPYTVLYPAEIYHQGYYRTHMDEPYIRAVSAVKVMKLRKAMSDLIKPEFKSK